MGEIIQAPIGFSYDELDEDVATDARDAAARIKSRTMSSVFDTGRDLISIKERLGHGRFRAWLHAELGLSERTAQNYMRAARAFDGKSEIVSYLPPTTVYRLAARSTPDAVRHEVLGRIDAGERPEPKVIEAMVSEAVGAKRVGARAKVAASNIEKGGAQVEEQSRRGAYDRDSSRADQKAAATEAARLIAQRFGEDLPQLLPLIERSGTELVGALRTMAMFLELAR
jgi:hypothetical protein